MLYVILLFSKHEIAAHLKVEGIFLLFIFFLFVVIQLKSTFYYSIKKMHNEQQYTHL